MINRCFLTLAMLFCVANVVLAQNTSETSGSERAFARSERHRLPGKENTIFLTLATGATSHNMINAGVKLEYARQIKGNFYWGCDFSANFGLGEFKNYDWSGDGAYRNTVKQNIYKLDGMAFYRVPVIRSRLFLRLGAGVGLGYHDIKGRDQELLRDKVLPYLNFQAAWILRISRGFEIKCSPTLVFAPSEFAISPVKLGAPTDVVPMMYDAGFMLGFGKRF